MPFKTNARGATFRMTDGAAAGESTPQCSYEG
jgi:hypothetical protein